jgi:hypothetical protein
VTTPPRVPVVLCVDVEPDERLVDRASTGPWLGYEATQRYVAALRSRLEDRTGAPVRFSWFLRMDPQVATVHGRASWVAERYRAHLDEVAARGDEIGVHPHAFRWLEAEGTWLQDFADQRWVEHCLRTSLDAFAKVFGRRCRAIRFGDRWLNTPTLNLAERLGIHYDLTIEPGAPTMASMRVDERTSAPLPDYRRVPREPYAPALIDFRRRARRGERSIRMIPLTSAHRRLPRRRVIARVRRVWRNGPRHWRQDTPLSMWKRWPAPNTFERMLDRALAAQARPYLAFAIRTDFADPDLRETMDICLRALLAHPAAPTFAVATPAEAMAHLGGNAAAG